MISNDFRANSEKRRTVRREIEKGVSGSEPDKIQINDIMLAALVIIAAVISFTDFSLSFGNIRNFTALTIFLYIITMFVYRNRYSKGIARGKKDEEYIRSLSEYREKRSYIFDNNLAGAVPAFCTYYKKKELREYRESLLCDIEMSYDEYKEKYIRMPNRAVMKQKLSTEAKQVIIKCNSAKSLRLYPGMILNENGEYDRHKLIGKSGRERERRDKRNQAISRAAYVIFGTLIAFDVIFNFSWLTIAQWIVRMLPVIIATISGDDGGYCNITVTEVNFKQGQINVINLFEEYISDNISDKCKEKILAKEEAKNDDKTKKEDFQAIEDQFC